MNDTYNAFSLRLGPDGLEVTPVYHPDNGIEVEVVEPAAEDDWEDHVDWQNFYADPPVIG